MKIFHISDLHARSNPKHNNGIEGKLRKLRDTLSPGNFVVCTGDITDDGTKEQYENALKLLTPFCGRIVLVPGNHDYGAAGNFYNEKCTKRYKLLESLLGYPKDEFYGVRFLRIDSVLKTENPFDFARGDISWWTRRKIKKFGLQCKEDKKVSIVCLHHTPFEEHWALEMKDPKAFLRACEGYVNYVLVGHEHKKRTVSFNKPGTPPITTYYSAPALKDNDGEPTEISIVSPYDK